MIGKTKIPYSNTELKEGYPLNENDDLVLLVGCGIDSYPFVPGSISHKRMFTGYINYQTHI